MDKLPAEVYDRIVHFVGRRIGEESVPHWEHRTLPFALPAIAAVSRLFQQAVERLTFRLLKVSTSSSDLDVFRRTLTPQRQSNLRRLTVHLWVDHSLPPTTPGAGQLRNVATAKERKAVNEKLTNQLRELFNILAAWRVTEPGLTLDVACPQRSNQPNDGSGEAYFRFAMLDVSSDFVDFPLLPMVKQLYVHSLSYYLHPHLAVSLTAKMPNVSLVDWDLSMCLTDRFDLYYYLSRIWRDGLVHSIESTTLPPSVEKFKFKMLAPGAGNFNNLPDFLGAASRLDPVSSALRKLTKNCTKLYIEGSIHSSLFDPLAVPGTAPHEATPAWEQVTHLEVRSSMCGPDGNWLFKFDPDNYLDREPTPDPPGEEFLHNAMPPSYGTTESEQDDADNKYDEFLERIAPKKVAQDFCDLEYFHTKVNDGPMNTLLAAFARGCGRGNLPALRTATFQSEFFNDNNWPIQIACFAAGTASWYEWDAEFADGDRSAWRVFFHVGDWRPTEETLEEFRQIGRERIGRDTVVCFLPWGDFGD
ncbi:hypothetical protein GGS21DRAFT_325410 [Xylaria nigripes]|nr:hypothetical protein GGS21DRAFT_325410 [Xylaria nigripes]